MAVEIRPHGNVGVEILGVDLARLDDADLAQIRAAFADHGVVFFRDQAIDEAAHIAFARNLGTININRFFAAHRRFPEIALVLKEPDQRENIGGGWHTDHSYDALPDALRAQIAGARAVHSARHVFGSKANAYEATRETRRDGRIGNATAADVLDDVVHPVVITHPLSGKRALYVNPGFTTAIVGLEPEESRALLAELYAHALQPQFQETFHWEPGSVALWDNRATWHYAHNDYHGHRREMHRITIAGEALQ